MDENYQNEQAKSSSVEWFDPDNINHLYAYYFLQQTGTWPRGFFPENIYIPPCWMSQLAFKIADRWVDHKLAKHKKSS